MGGVTARYVELCRESGGGMRTAVVGADLPVPLRGLRLLARPLFVEEEVLHAAVEDLLCLFDVLSSLPERLFGGGIGGYWAAVGGDPRLVPLLRRFAPGGPTVRFGRADLYRTERGFSLLEFNVGGGVGGFELGELPRALSAVGVFAEFAGRYGLNHVRTAERVAATLRAASPRPSPVVALVFAPGMLPRFRRPLAPTVAVLAGQGLEVVLGELGDVRDGGGRLFVGGARVDVVLRFFSVDDTIGYEEHIEAVVRAHLAGNAVLWTGLDSTLFTNKGALALLSDPRCDAVLSPQERRARERILPWTRMLTADLVDRCVVEREELVLKPCRGFAGTGVVTGWTCPDRDWFDVLCAHAGQAFVVQRRVVPRLEAVVDPDTGVVEDWTAVWGLFVTPGGYGGNAVRAQRAAGGGVIGYSTDTATRATVAFSHPAGGQPAASARGAVEP
ncbi:hypothetical protein ACFC1R_37285 [Kitasatospora sp. NPDC056138]|uniref:hypothetical protein n=1 Tax=Kitasatospora sp. NPDC056138 TaxID=3345724 RepID=UPI0035DD769D